MIREKARKSKFNITKTPKQVVLEFMRTILCSCIMAGLITAGLLWHSRNEMIRNLYINQGRSEALDKMLAQSIISQNDLLLDLSSKSYGICMTTGNIFYAAGDYKNAETAYRFALDKAKSGNYGPYYKLVCALAAQEKFDEAEELITGLQEHTNVKLIKFKTRAYIVIGDKYYSMSKFISAAKAYEKANFYYNKFSKKDQVIQDRITSSISQSYQHAADIMVKNNMNSEAERFLRKAEKYTPDDFSIKYKIAIVLSDYDPEKAIKYLEELLNKCPQHIDYGIYGNALMKAATIAELDNRPTQAKYYRYKIHSIDMFLNRKVIYRNDIDVSLSSIQVKKKLFVYPISAKYQFLNVSNQDIIHLYGDFVLCHNNKPVETVKAVIADRDKPMFATGYEPNEVSISFKKKIYSKKELETYTIKIYIYKDSKFKTLAAETRIPKKSF